MKALVFEAPGRLKWKNVPEPVLQEPYGAILHPVAISVCSSDIHTVYGGGVPKQTNHIMGHECLARIVRLGQQVRDFQVGEVVAVPAITPDWRAADVQLLNERHAGEHFSGHRLGRTWPGVFADYFALPDADTMLAHIPENVTMEQALMSVDVMTTGFTGAEYAQIKSGDTVCVMGIGPVGLMAVAGAAHMGAARIIAVGTRPVCVKLAKQYGANDIVSYKNGDTVQQILRMTDGVGPDSVIIAGGGDEAFTQAVDMVRYGIGTVSNVNYYGGTGFLAFPKFSGGRGMAGKTVHTELAKGGRVRIERMMSLIRYGRVDPGPLVTHQFNGLDELTSAVDLMRQKPPELIKTMVRID